MKKFLATILSVILLLTIIPMAYAEETNTYKVGDIIQFGSYPQSEVKDEELIAELNQLAPEWDEWTSYGYYSGEDEEDTMVQGDWMRYFDVTYNGTKYRAVKFEHSRPSYTIYSFFNIEYQTENGYITNTVYWFKFEPIDWRVLDPETGLVMCDTIIDSQPYNNTIYYNYRERDFTYAYCSDASFTNYSSDYETSSIRQWLNDDFYNTAFTESEKEEIKTTTLNNDGYYTSVGTSGYEALDSNSTNDKIFLLSYNEVRNSNFGFSSDGSAYDSARQAQSSDYAKSQGVLVRTGNSGDDNSYWLLRSPGDISHSCCFVKNNGDVDNICGVVYTDIGVRPALELKSISDSGQAEHQHFYTSSVTTEPTHTTVGIRTYTCECNDSYTEEIPKLEGHTYTSEVTTEPTHTTVGVRTYTCECNDSYTEEIPKLEGHTYASKVTKEATHTTVGVRTFTCECGDNYTEEIAKLEGHTYSSTVTAPTCTTQGYTTYTCACGDTYVADYVNALGHKDNNGDYKCDNGCGYEYEKPTPENPDTPEDPSTDCSCNCHKDGFMGFIWKIMNFFNKLFKTKQYCSCGAKHW